jgi:hypothetical protein
MTRNGPAILALLEANPPMRAKDISAALNLGHPGLMKAIRKLRDMQLTAVSSKGLWSTPAKIKAYLEIDDPKRAARRQAYLVAANQQRIEMRRLAVEQGREALERYTNEIQQRSIPAAGAPKIKTRAVRSVFELVKEKA